MVKYLITGAGGFIGSHLVNKIIEEGNSTVVAFYSHPPNFKNPMVKQIIADLSQPGWTSHISNSVDIVYHLVQSKHYREFPEGALDMAAVNIMSTVEILEWSRRNNVKKFFYSSTANIYKKTKQKIDSSFPCEPCSMYAATKLSAEYLVQQYEEYFQTAILRLFTIYGPKQREMLIPSIIEKVILDREIFLAKGNGIFLTPLFISDCIEMLIGLKDSMQSKTIRLNIAGSNVVSLKEIIDIIEDCLNKKSIRIITDEEPHSLIGKNDKVCQSISYRPTVDIRRGLQLTVEEFVQNVAK
jgi:nucleoside-diphosphate-sugar epimerase